MHKQGATLSDTSQAHQNLLEFYNAMGIGMFAGIVASGFSHLVFGAPAAIVMIFVYGLSLYREHGWREYCGLLAMSGTVVGYYAIYESFRRSTSLIVSIGLSALIVGLFAIYLYWVAAWTARARARALARKDKISEDQALELPLSRTESWLEPVFAALRAKKTAGTGPPVVLIRSVLFVVASLAIGYWIHDRVIQAIAASVFIFQVVVGARVLRYLSRLGQPGVDTLLERDLRPPVLFLRSFKLDELPVDRIEEGWRGMLDMFSVGEKTFEERLTDTFKDIGPLIAIGRPGEDAAPLGAAREYADNDSWQQVVLERADAAQLVIMELDATAGMEWEIENVSKLIGLERIAIVLPPGEDIHEPRSPAWYERWAALRKRFSFLPEVFGDTIAVLFDEKEQPILVSSDASSIQKQLAEVKTAWLQHAPKMRPGGIKKAYQRALAVGEKALGPDHPDVAILLGNLGLVLKDLGEYAEARAALERALAILEKSLPPDHPDILLVKQNLEALQ
jgi:hypothetical protein